MPDYEWTRDDRGVDMYNKHYPFDAGDKHNFEWVVNNFEELAKAFPEIAKEFTSLLRFAYLDINYLLIEGFDSNVEDCEMDGVKDTIKEIEKFVGKGNLRSN